MADLLFKKLMENVSNSMLSRELCNLLILMKIYYGIGQIYE